MMNKIKQTASVTQTMLPTGILWKSNADNHKQLAASLHKLYTTVQLSSLLASTVI
jgi:hypothetical protein